VLTPVKKEKGQCYLEPSDQWLSTAVSRVRQPTEALFGWLEEKTGIECASKVRSYIGLMVHRPPETAAIKAPIAAPGAQGRLRHANMMMNTDQFEKPRQHPDTHTAFQSK